MKGAFRVAFGVALCFAASGGMLLSGSAHAQWYKVNRHDLPLPKKPKDLIPVISKHDVYKVVPRIDGGDVGKTATTAWHQFHDGTVHVGHQTATNFRSVSEYIDARMASFCELMGPDESCVEDGMGVSVDSNGNTQTYNPKSGQSFPILGTEAEPVVLPSIVIMQPGAKLQASQQWRDVSLAVAGSPLDVWAVSYWRLPPEIQANTEVAANWENFRQQLQTAKAAQVSGRVRPFVALPPETSVSAGDAIKTAYDTTRTAADVWDVVMGAYQFSWWGIASSIVSPERIADEPKIVMGLYPEEVAAVRAADAYYRSLPPEVRIAHEAELARQRGDMYIEATPPGSLPPAQ